MNQQPTKIFISAGIPGSGKSYWFAKNFDTTLPSVALVSRDLARLALTGDMGNHDCELRVTQLVESQYLGAIKDPNVTDILVDTTSVRYKDRKEYYKLAEKSGYPVEFHLIIFKNFEEAIKQNQSRDRVVPDVDMQRMLGRFEAPKKEDLPRCTSVTEITSVQDYTAVTYFPQIKA